MKMRFQQIERIFEKKDRIKKGGFRVLKQKAN